MAASAERRSKFGCSFTFISLEHEFTPDIRRTIHSYCYRVFRFRLFPRGPILHLIGKRASWTSSHNFIQLSIFHKVWLPPGLPVQFEEWTGCSNAFLGVDTQCGVPGHAGSFSFEGMDFFLGQEKLLLVVSMMPDVGQQAGAQGCVGCTRWRPQK